MKKLIFILLFAIVGNSADVATKKIAQQKHSICAACHKTGAEKRCSICKSTHYCSQTCQKKDWVIHKDSCRIIAMLKKLGYEQKSREFLTTPIAFSRTDLEGYLGDILIPVSIPDSILESHGNTGHYRTFRDIHKHFVALSKSHGFKCKSAERARYVRDCPARFASSALKCTTKPVSSQKIQGSLCSFYANYRPVPHKIFAGVASLAIANFFIDPKKYCDDFNDGPMQEIKETVGIYDGGNIMVLTNRLGKPMTLIGESSVVINQMMLHETGFFNQPEVKLFIDDFKEILKDFPPLESDLAGFSKDERCTFLAETAYVKQQLIPKDLGIAAENIVYVEQLAYHLDIFLAPAPKGGILVMDLAKSTALLTEMLKVKRLQELIQSLTLAYEFTKQNTDGLVHLTNAVVGELQKAGFDVVRAPSAFITGTSETSFINFLNPIYGKSKESDDKSDRKYPEQPIDNAKSSYFWYTVDPCGQENHALIQELKKVWQVFLKDIVFYNHKLDTGFLAVSHEGLFGAGAHCFYSELTPLRSF